MISGLSARPALTPLPAAMAFAVAALALTTVGLAPEAAAQARANAQAQPSQSRSLRDRLFGRNLPPVGRYVSESGESFVLDQSGARPLLRFESRQETWVLRPSSAPRGDTIYRNDAGDQILRITPDGGVTLYTVRAPNGSPASAAGPASPLSPPTLGPVRLFQFMGRQGRIVSQAVGRLVYFDVDTSPASEAVTVETITSVTEAITRMARTEGYRQRLNRLRSIRIAESDRTLVSFSSNGVLTVLIDARQGLAGRPSSARIIQALDR
jgi:hypothetical protein